VPRKRKEPVAVSEDTIQAAEATETVEAVPTPAEAAQAEALAIVEAARKEAAAIRQAAIEEAQAATQRVAKVEEVVNEPDPAPEGANIVPEPVPSKTPGKPVETFFPGITRIDY
jgi:hypothetical protein